MSPPGTAFFRRGERRAAGGSRKVFLGGDEMKKKLFLSTGLLLVASCAAFAKTVYELDHVSLFDPPV